MAGTKPGHDGNKSFLSCYREPEKVAAFSAGLCGSANGSREHAPITGSNQTVLSPQRLQSRFDFGAARLQEWRQRQFFAERLHRLVGGEAGPAGGDLKQDAVRLAEIKAAKIKALDLAAVA